MKKKTKNHRICRTESMTDRENIYCPGCGHGIIHRLIAEVIDELELRDRTIGIAPVGCAVFAYFYWNFDVAEASHGRPPAVATGVKRVLPDRIAFTYQGDGDLAAIGTAEVMHAANRGENITHLNKYYDQVSALWREGYYLYMPARAKIVLFMEVLYNWDKIMADFTAAQEIINTLYAQGNNRTAMQQEANLIKARGFWEECDYESTQKYLQEIQGSVLEV